MEEQEIEVVVVAVECDALLPLDEREARPKLEDKALDLAEDRRLEVLLAVRVGELEEIEHVWVSEHKRRCELTLLVERREFAADQRLRFLESAVRSNSMPSIFCAGVRVDHPATRHISA